MKAMILAAGRGSRMGNLTEVKPKCLTELAGKALLDWQLEALESAGIQDCAVVTGYRAELLERSGLKSFYNPRWQETNMVMSLATASDWLSTADCLISYGDIVYSADTVSALKQADGDLVLAANTGWLRLWLARFAEPLSDAESFMTDPQGHLLDIGRRVTDYAEVQGQYMGLLKITPAGWTKIHSHLESLSPDICDKLDMTSLLRQLLAKGVQISTVNVDGGWLEIDSPEDLAAMQEVINSWPEFAWLHQSNTL